MPSVEGIDVNVSAEAARRIEHNRRVQEEINAMLHGTLEQRRRHLRMRHLPLPDDPESVAVLGMAVLDLPSHTRAATQRGLRRNTSSRGFFDPLQALADRYGVRRREELEEEAEAEANNAGGLDYTSFVEVLCPDGTSLLENLPLTPARTKLKDTATPSHHASAISRKDPSNPLQLHQHPAGRDSGGTQSSDERGDTTSTHASAPRHPSLNNTDGTTTSATSPAKRAESVISAIQIFISCGSVVIAPPASAHRSPRRAKQRRSQPSNNSRRNQPSHNRNSPHDPFAPFSCCTAGCAQDVADWTTNVHNDAPRTTEQRGGCDLGGRVLLTDRLVQSQAHTTLPVMAEAFQQYKKAAKAVFRQAASPASSAATSSSAQVRGTLSDRETWKQLSTAQHVAMVQKALAPRQRGLVLAMNNADPEVQKCVAEAHSCTRPTFRYMSAEYTYGSSTYQTS